MKIMHLLPSLQSGGVEQVVLELGEGLTAAGTENIVVSAGGAMVPALESTGARHITLDIGRKSLATFLQVSKVKQLITRERPDILHLHSRVPAWVGFLATKGLTTSVRPSVVTTFHGFYSVNFYSKIMTRGQRIIAVSQSVREHILKAYPKTPANRICVIPNSIDPSAVFCGYRPSEAWMNEWHHSFPELDGKYTLCLPGRITRLKGHEDLIAILSSLREHGIPAHAVIVGETKRGKEAYRLELENAFAAAGLADAVTWTGHRTDFRDVLCACDITLSLTHVPESFGKTTLEALALGRPVAGYAHGGVEEQLKTFLPTGLIPPGDTHTMANLLAQWYTERPATPKEIPAPYRRTDMINAHIRLYEELLHRQN